MGSEGVLPWGPTIRREGEVSFFQRCHFILIFHNSLRAPLFKKILFLLFMLLELFLLFLPFPTSTQPHLLPSPSQPPYCRLCPWAVQKCSLGNPFTVFHPTPHPFPAAVSLFYVSKLLLLFCLLIFMFL